MQLESLDGELCERCVKRLVLLFRSGQIVAQTGPFGHDVRIMPGWICTIGKGK